MNFSPTLLVYGAPLLAIWILVYLRRTVSERKAVRVKSEAVDAGLDQPASLHPIIDPAICIGCGACVTACPEGKILGLVHGKAQLIEPAHCIGHGACADACPMDGITLVFGTEQRGVDIPDVGPDFQTNQPGIFIAGELGGMGLIRNAIAQGRQAMAQIAKSTADGAGDMLDVVIVGAGPAGISASLAAQEAGLNFVTLEQDSLGGTVSHFPRGKLVMTAPAELPVYGTVKFREISKEALLEFWQGVVTKTGLKINFNERVDQIDKEPDGFRVVTPDNTYLARKILLAIGRRGTPRKLGVDGEETSKVVYRLIDAEQYSGQHVLVVGGGDSALEAASSIAEVAGTKVSLSYRNEGFARAKQKNRDRAAALNQDGKLDFYFRSTVAEIQTESVKLLHNGLNVTLINDAVIVCAGGILPSGFLKSAGVNIETKYGTR